MSAALKATGRPIVFSMCNPDPTDDPWVWGAPIANLWRTTTDIEDNFGSMLANFQGTRRTEWAQLLAGNVIATMPLILAFLFAQRKFIATMSFTGIKG